jgi:hypothetical protein
MLPRVEFRVDSMNESSKKALDRVYDARTSYDEKVDLAYRIEMTIYNRLFMNANPCAMFATKAELHMANVS